MRELVSEALVLRVENSGETAKSVFLLTEAAGRLKARAIGAGKTLSKFSPHIEPGSLIEVRLAGNSGWTITDAVGLQPSWFRFPGANLENISSSLRLLENLSAPAADSDLWLAVRAALPDNLKPALFLDVFGYSFSHSACFKCGAARPEYFCFADHSFFCAAHAAEIPAEKKIRC